MDNNTKQRTYEWKGKSPLKPRFGVIVLRDPELLAGCDAQQEISSPESACWCAYFGEFGYGPLCSPRSHEFTRRRRRKPEACGTRGKYLYHPFPSHTERLAFSQTFITSPFGFVKSPTSIMETVLNDPDRDMADIPTSFPDRPRCFPTNHWQFQATAPGTSRSLPQLTTTVFYVSVLVVHATWFPDTQNQMESTLQHTLNGLLHGEERANGKSLWAIVLSGRMGLA